MHPTRTPVRWSVRTPGMPPRMERLRFMSADAGAAGTPGVVPGTPPVATPPAGAPATPATPATVPPAVPAAPATTPPAGAPGANLPTDPAALQQMILDLRRENASDRTAAKTTAAEEAKTELAQTIGKALGIIKDGDAAPDPAALAAEITEARTDARAAKVELAVFKTAALHGGNPAALTDSRAFLAKVADLDPAAADFQTKVIDAAKTAVTENNTLKATQVAARSSIPNAGGTGEGTVRKPMTMADAVAATLGTA